MTATTHAYISIALLTGFFLPSLLMIGAWVTRPITSRHSQQKLPIHFSGGLLLFSIIMTLLGIGLITALLLLIAPDSNNKSDWLYAFISALVIGMASATSLRAWLPQCVFTDQGIEQAGILWRKSIPWSQLEKVEHKSKRGSLQLSGRSHSIDIWLPLDEPEEVLQSILKLAPWIRVDTSLKTDKWNTAAATEDTLAEYAGRGILISAIVTLSTLLFTPLAIKPALISALAGLPLALGTAYKTAASEPVEKVYIFIQMTGIMGFSLLSNIARSIAEKTQHINGDEHWLALLIQQLSIAILVAFLLVFLARIMALRKTQKP